MKILVLCGGTSTERDVSLVTGKMVFEALKGLGHQVVLMDVFLGEKESCEDYFTLEKDWTGAIGAVTENRTDIESVKALREGERSFFGPNVLRCCEQADVVFMALHGSNGEDGRIQATLELMGVPFTGTDYVSAAMAMDKGITKDIFYAHNIPTPKGIRLKKGETETEKVPYPCIVKAVCGGSSVGVTVANNDEEYEAAKEEGYRYDNEVVIEQFIKGREFSVGVIDGKALPIIEIAPKVGFYDYKNKYQAGSTVETCPADLPAEKTAEMQSIAEQVFAALRLKNYARMDFMMDAQNNLYCLEANTLPGMTPTSLLPQEAAAIGIDFPNLCQKLIDLSLR